MYTTPSNTLYIDQHVQGTGQTLSTLKVSKFLSKVILICFVDCIIKSFV